MSNKFKGTLFEHFGDLKDPRVERTRLHQLFDILAIAICAVISGADTWEDIEAYGKAKEAWLCSFLELPNGIPSHDTFARVIGRINPEAFQACFVAWVQSLQELTGGTVVAIDGKTLRRTCDPAQGKAALHMVSAWAAENRLVLAQRQVDGKSNEITAIPELLRMLEIEGCIVTIDAMGCQTEIAAQIVEQGADYVLTLKGNQGQLADDVAAFFQGLGTSARSDGVVLHATKEQAHGRAETRRYWSSPLPESLRGAERWKGLRSIGMVEASRTISAETSVEVRYYLSSLAPDAQQLAYASRTHWGIENQVHWILDVAFRQDDCRISTYHGPENVALLHHIALNLLRQESSSKRGVKAKRKRAGWDDSYLEKVIGISLS